MIIYLDELLTTQPRNEMITKVEIDEKAKEFEIHSSNVERDYVFGWILRGLFTISKLKDIIFLKGGNALRKGYFQQTRFSSDLDLGIPNDIPETILLDEINLICEWIKENSNINFVTEENKIKEKFQEGKEPLPDLKVYEIRIYFKDFYGTSNHIKLKVVMDVTRFDKVILPIQNLKLIHPYSDADQVVCTIRCMKLEEIIATKLKCAMQRQHAPDIFDYAHSLKILGGTLDKKEVVQTLIEKTIFKRNPYMLKRILSATQFEYLKAQWLKTIICAKTIILQSEEAVSILLADLEEIFQGYPDNRFADFDYFTPEQRQPIMEAGRRQTLLKIRYNGSDRVVEPYSLKYLQKRDGKQREYLFVWNRLGGSNPPGIRQLLAEGLTSIEVTNERFEPRIQIELSKAGEVPENPYLFDPNRPMQSPKRSRRLIRFGKSRTILKFVYRCNTCGKKFVRMRQTSGILGPHKSKNGYRCNGRYGSYVEAKYYQA